MNLILTFDYELFGDGSGDVFTHIIEPTNTILSFCNKYGIKITIFFEILEYIKIKNEWEKGNTMGYKQNPAEAIENQIQQAALNGHDIQLHIHPQWYDAKYENDKWTVNMKNWRLGDFRTNENYTITDLISDCKRELENLIKIVLPNYECIALRAGGYNIIPSTEIYNAMKKNNIIIDSSIYPGGYENGTLSKYDYRNISNDFDYWWGREHDLREQSNNQKNILEIPIFSLEIFRWQRLITISKIKSLLFQRKTSMSSVTKEKVDKKNFIEKIQFLLKKEATTWDVCLFPKSLHKKYFKYIEKNLENKRKSFVLIGHPKSLRNENLFSDFLKLTFKNEHKYTFKTIREYYAEIV